LAQFSGQTKILLHRQTSTRKAVPPHGTLIAPNSPTSRCIVYIAHNIVYYIIICGEMKAGENIYECIVRFSLSSASLASG
jgi:hypothetical protein